MRVQRCWHHGERVRTEVRWEGKKLKDEEKNRKDAELRIEVDMTDVINYTDGSALEGWKNGGAGVVVMRGKERKGEVRMKKRLLLIPGRDESNRCSVGVAI